MTTRTPDGGSNMADPGDFGCLADRRHADVANVLDFETRVPSALSAA
jgi:hypothetical protein